jgi:hypothetical protein
MISLGPLKVSILVGHKLFLFLSAFWGRPLVPESYDHLLLDLLAAVT